jgi:hypothetical protein
MLAGVQSESENVVDPHSNQLAGSPTAGDPFAFRESAYPLLVTAVGF